MTINRSETCAIEGAVDLGEALRAETCEEAEGEVKRADVGSSERAPGLAPRDGEVGEDPKAAGGDAGGEVLSEGVEVVWVEAVEEKVGNDEVSLTEIQAGGEARGGGLEGLEAGGGEGAALAKEVEHGGAGVDCEDVEVRGAAEELGEETAVAIAQDEGVGDGGELGEEVLAGAGEERAEKEVFGPAVEAGDGVEVGRGGARTRFRGHRCRRAMTIARGSGVRRQRSARARRVSARVRWRVACRTSRDAKARAHARGAAAGWASGEGPGWPAIARERMLAAKVPVRARRLRWLTAQRVEGCASQRLSGCSQA